jgi:Domain of unknown function (DUF5667)
MKRLTNVYSEINKKGEKFMKKLFVHTTATALLLSQLGLANTALAAENETSPTNDQIQNEEAPTLVKGDFFYFVKTTVEKIQLLLTTDKVKEAELLAEFAQERIHEARELIKEGNEDLAKETLKEALTKMEVAQGTVEVKLPTDESTTNTTTEGTTTEGTTTEGTTTEDTTTTTPVQDTEKEEVDKEDADKEEVEKEEKEEKQKLTKEQKEIAKIQHHLNNNLLVLANVLDQVKNPKAKAAIAKNIEKSFNKISERLEKVLKSTEQKETVLNPVITIKYPEATTEKASTPEVVTTITKIEDVEENTTTDTTTKLEADVNKSENETETETDEVKVEENKKVKNQHKVEKKPVHVVKVKEVKEVKREVKVKENRGNHYGQNHAQHNKTKGHENHQSKEHGHKKNHDEKENGKNK